MRTDCWLPQGPLPGQQKDRLFEFPLDLQEGVYSTSFHVSTYDQVYIAYPVLQFGSACATTDESDASGL